MRVLVTAGNTQVPIDQVRVITSVFTGRTGAAIAVEGYLRGHQVTLLTSHPEVVVAPSGFPADPSRWSVCTYRTFDELEGCISNLVRQGSFDAIIHAAAVSDYRISGVYLPSADGSRQEISASKIPSTYPELWLRLTPTPKLVDRFRRDWGYQGLLVKFKLEADRGDTELLAIAEQSRLHSRADLLVANRLEDRGQWAWLGPLQGGYQRVERSALPRSLWQAVEELFISHSSNPPHQG
ncbi:MAG: phosphopantothenoylcysteine decarboxylase [Gemmataceae bacterium]|nr:phosphopantothenoylcysteine decarboxylase [Gemmataceae bacterium]MCS7271536.1 phosphopantothenoylcysteine decarboxylase [Gemmataceae bacterium]MDW8244110.1 phosphopantothenoylcysteine decarboxylase [Thermogemmata sp.]